MDFVDEIDYKHSKISRMVMKNDRWYYYHNFIISRFLDFIGLIVFISSVKEKHLNEIDFLYYTF